ncbi:hypothetical protein FRC11_009582, partial [Ceratobasidium sp. 423]
STTYTPPTLPVHVSVQLEPVTGTPSEEQVIKVQDATRLYHQFSNVPSMFDPRVNMELSQHLFDIQMGKFVQKGLLVSTHATSIPQRATSTNLARAFETAANLVGEPSASNTNNTGTGTDAAPGPAAQADTDIRDAIERSNRLAEQANQLIERSNQLAERSNQIAQRSNQLVEQSNRPADQSNRIGERFNELFERLNQHLKQSNELVKESTRPVEKLGDVLGNINRVLVRIQHAIVRNHKGNTVRALDCLVNEKGETPAVSRTTQNFLFADFSKAGAHLLPVVIDGIAQDAGIPDWMLGEFLCFYGIGDELRESMSSIELREGREQEARAMLKNYLISCLG